MSLFTNKNDKESKEEKNKKILQKLNAKIEKLGLDDLSLEEKEEVRLILCNLTGAVGIVFGSTPSDDAQISLAQAQIEQNWLLLKKLNDIDKKLEKISNNNTVYQLK